MSEFLIDGFVVLERGRSVEISSVSPDDHLIKVSITAEGRLLIAEAHGGVRGTRVIEWTDKGVHLVHTDGKLSNGVTWIDRRRES